MNTLTHEQGLHNNRLGLSKAGRKQLIDDTLNSLRACRLMGPFFFFRQKFATLKIVVKIERIKTDKDFGFPLRITTRKAHPLKGGGVKSPHLLVKCGCCNEKVEIYYDNDGLEINGVNGTIHQWRKVLLPLLDIKIPKGKK